MTNDDVWFNFFLARELQMTVGGLNEQMSSREYQSWKAWYRLKWERQSRRGK